MKALVLVFVLVYSNTWGIRRVQDHDKKGTKLKRFSRRMAEGLLKLQVMQKNIRIKGAGVT